MMKSIKSQLESAASLMARAADDEGLISQINSLTHVLAKAYGNGHKLIICGNGGSACDAMHVAEEFTGRFSRDRKALPAISLTDPGHLTCVANDYGYDDVFSRGVEAFGKAGDVFIGLSTSGNSKNVINAMRTARDIGLKTASLLGKDGGILKGLADIDIIVPGETTDRIQEIHMTILHIVIEHTENELFG